MLKIKEVTSLFQIKPDVYVLVDGEYKKVVEYSSSVDVGYIEFEDGSEMELAKADIGNYSYATFDDPSGAIGVDVYYRCKLCNNPSIAFEGKGQAEKHAEKCLFNSNAKSCVLCKHLKIIENAPYPRFAKEYKSVETYHAFGAFKHPYCMLKDKEIDERELFGDHQDCFSFTEEPAVVEQTPEFEKYWELINSDDIYSKKISQEELLEMLEKEEDIN